MSKLSTSLKTLRVWRRRLHLDRDGPTVGRCRNLLTERDRGRLHSPVEQPHTLARRTRTAANSACAPENPRGAHLVTGQGQSPATCSCDLDSGGDGCSIEPVAEEDGFGRRQSQGHRCHAKAIVSPSGTMRMTASTSCAGRFTAEDRHGLLQSWHGAGWSRTSPVERTRGDLAVMSAAQQFTVAHFAQGASALCF